MRFHLEKQFSFRLKIAGAIGLALFADLLFFRKEPGSTLGLFALAWVAAVAICVPRVRKDKAAVIALACAVLLGLALFDRPGPLPVLLGWIALSSSVLLARTQFQDAAQLCLRLAAQGFVGLGNIVRDTAHVLRVPRPTFGSSLRSGIAAVVLPLAGAGIFIALFASANPIIESLLPDLSVFAIDGDIVFQGFFCALVFVGVWPSLRPSRAAIGMTFTPAKHPLNLPGVTAASITLSLLLFNVIFAVQNGLDVAFLWSGAPLPQGVTLADYAHRGAYPLIVTALLAGAFVLITAQPDSEIGRRPLIRRLVVIWIVQNLVLVASSIIRTIDYIDAYMLTQLRIAALLWMALVAVGLVLICWRMVMRHALGWLINRTALAAAAVLGLACIVDLGTVAAEWNIRHARETGRTGQPLDLGYLRSLGSSAMVPLARLEKQPLNSEFLDRVAFVRQDIVEAVQHEQQEAYAWTWRNARRLENVRSILGPSPRVPAPGERHLDGRLLPPPVEVPTPPPAPPVDGIISDVPYPGRPLTQPWPR
ncbi:MAG TPA: DUF4173 domain-containing protein [Rhizomicrobium sp.]|nr:DUF4173 domain-containing protein [Rhizomicrobium sp.]